MPNYQKAILDAIQAEKVVSEDAIYEAFPSTSFDEVTDAIQDLLQTNLIEAIDTGGTFHTFGYVPKPYVQALLALGLIEPDDEPDEDGKPWYYWTKSSGYSGR